MNYRIILKNHLFQALIYKFKGGIELKKGPKRVKALKSKEFNIINFIKCHVFKPSYGQYLADSNDYRDILLNKTSISRFLMSMEKSNIKQGLSLNKSNKTVIQSYLTFTIFKSMYSYFEYSKVFVDIDRKVLLSGR